MINFLLITAAVILITFWLYKRLTSEGEFSLDKQGIPYEKPLPIVGNFLPIFQGKESGFDLFERVYSKFSNHK